MKTRLALEEAREVQTKCLDTLAETYALQCESHELQCDLMETLRHLQELALRAGVTIIVATEAATTAACSAHPRPIGRGYSRRLEPLKPTSTDG